MELHRLRLSLESDPRNQDHLDWEGSNASKRHVRRWYLLIAFDGLCSADDCDIEVLRIHRLLATIKGDWLLSALRMMICKISWSKL